MSIVLSKAGEGKRITHTHIYGQGSSDVFGIHESLSLPNTHQPLTDVSQRAGHHSAKQKVASSIPSQGTCLGCRPGPWLGRAMLLSLYFSLPSLLSKNKFKNLKNKQYT